MVLTERKRFGRSPVFAFHRESDWATKNAPDVASELHRCDALAVRANAVLTGVRQRICLELVVSCAAHLLSLVDRRPRGRRGEDRGCLEPSTPRSARSRPTTATRRTGRRSSSTSVASPRSSSSSGRRRRLAVHQWATPVAALVAGALGARRERGPADQQRQVRARVRRRRAVHVLPRRPAAADRRRSQWRSRSPSTAAFSTSLSPRREHGPSPAGAARPRFLAGFSERWAQDTLTPAPPREERAGADACGLALVRDGFGAFPGPVARKGRPVSDPRVGHPENTQKRFGWRLDHPDMRDFLLAVEPAKALPRRVSLRSHMPPVYDQGQLGSCTANSIGAILEFNELRARAESDATTPSRLFIYYNERAMEGTITQAGLRRRDPRRDQVGRATGRSAGDRLAVRDLEVRDQAARQGVQGCSQAPGDPVRARCLRRRWRSRTCSPPGYPISFGFTVYESFESARRLGRNRPDARARRTNVLGGHAVVAIGYKHIQRPALLRVPQLLGARLGPTTATSGCRRATSRAAASRGDFWVIKQVE